MSRAIASLLEREPAPPDHLCGLGYSPADARQSAAENKVCWHAERLLNMVHAYCDIRDSWTGWLRSGAMGRTLYEGIVPEMHTLLRHERRILDKPSVTGLPAGLAFDPAALEVDGTPSAAGTARVTYAVEDADGDSDSGMFDWVIAAPANQAPRANAGADQSVAAGARVTLDGSASDDADGSIASYAWAQTAGDTVQLVDGATVTPEFDAPSTASAQTLTFRLTVTDDDGAESFDDVSVAVAAMAPPNQAPTANAGADQNVAAGGVDAQDGRRRPDVARGGEQRREDGRAMVDQRLERGRPRADGGRDPGAPPR